MALHTKQCHASDSTIPGLLDVKIERQIKEVIEYHHRFHDIPAPSDMSEIICYFSSFLGFLHSEKRGSMFALIGEDMLSHRNPNSECHSFRARDISMSDAFPSKVRRILEGNKERVPGRVTIEDISNGYQRQLWYL